MTSNEVAPMKMNKISTLETQTSDSTQIQIETNVKTNSNDEQNEYRWDLITWLYLSGLFVATASFGVAQDSAINKFMLMCIFFHFTGESVLVINVLFSKKIAKILSIIILVFLGLEIFVMIPVGPISISKNVFSVQFVIADAVAALTGLAVMLNENVTGEMRKVGMSLLFHFVGISFALALMTKSFYANAFQPDQGEGWTLLGATAIPQTYLMKDALLSKWNIGSNKQNSCSNYIKLQIKILVFIVGCIIFPLAVLMLSTYRTTDDVTGNTFAGKRWGVVIDILGYPLGGFGLIFVTFLWKEGRVQLKKKLYAE
eukprot:463016_1